MVEPCFFCLGFSSQAPKFGNFQLTSPQIWKFSTHKPPFSEANVSLQAPHFGNPGRTPLPEKKLSAPPPGHVRKKHRAGGEFHLDSRKDFCKNLWILLHLICVSCMSHFLL